MDRIEDRIGWNRFACLLVSAVLTSQLLSGCACTNCGPDIAVGNLSGRVVTDRGAPIKGATVTVGLHSTRSDETGHYYLSMVVGGNQTVSAYIAGYTDDGRGTRLVYIEDYRNKYVTEVADLILVPVSSATDRN